METKNQPLSSRDIERICDASLELNPYFDYGEIVFFLSNFEKVDKITLKFEKSNFIHLLGLEVSKSFLKNSWLVNCPSKELFYNLCLIKRIEDQDYELKYSHREIREKIEAVEFFSKCFKKGGIFSKANDKNQKTIGADCFISNNELQIGLREIEPDVFVPVSAQKAKTHKKINLHQRYRIIACKQTDSANNCKFSFVYNQINSEQAKEVISSQLIAFKHFDVCKNRNQRRLVSRSMGTRFLSSLIDKQEQLSKN